MEKDKVQSSTVKVCGQKTQTYTRVTGFYSPVQNFNTGKMQEFKDRNYYKI
jgi:ribonucleoside-triphosphate reductase